MNIPLHQFGIRATESTVVLGSASMTTTYYLPQRQKFTIHISQKKKKKLMNPQNKISSYHSLFFDDDYVSDQVIVEFDKPPIFDEEYVTEPVIVDFDKPSVFDEDLFQNEQHERDSIFEDYFYDVAVFHHSIASSTYLFLKIVKIRGRIFSNLKRMMQQQLRQWNTWSGWRIRI